MKIIVPVLNILDKRFRYTPAASTDISKLFKRVRAEQKAKANQDARNEEEAAAKTVQLKERIA